MKIPFTLIIFLFVLTTTNLQAQDKPISPSVVGKGVFLGETKPLRDIPALTPAELKQLDKKLRHRELNEGLEKREYPFADIALPKGPDPVWQSQAAQNTKAPSTAQIFAGQSTSSYPPDCNGTMGQNYFMQTINTTYAIYDRTGTKVAGPTNMNQLFNGVTGSNCNDGDPIVLYDEMADRWLACEFSLCGSNDRMMLAVSTTNDPTGTWYAYSFDVADLPDYPKFSVWQDGYYMGDNNSSGNDIYVFDRNQMLTGGTSPGFVGFNNPWRPGSVDGFMCVPPVDNDGASAPTGAPGLFIALSDDAFNSGTDQLWIYELHVNWQSTSSSTFNRVQQIDVAPFDSNFGNNWTNIKQLGTSQELDAVPQVIMNVPQYRNFGSYQTLVCCHTVDVDNTDHAGVRWYELRKTGTSNWTVRQQGTYAPDAHSRWMGSIMMNGSNAIGLGYSISSSTINPGIRVCGQTPAEYLNASGIMDYPEEIIHTGTASQTGIERWGDYSSMAVDPADDGTFWYTNQYVSGGSKTKIASFTVGPLLPSVDFTASNTLPCKDNTIVNFTSNTTGSPTVYSWSFTPNTVTYANGTTSASTNPQVVFNAYGPYTVALTVTNTAGSNTATKTDFVHVNVANPLFSANATTVVVGNSITFTDASTCDATSWNWNFGDGATPTTANTQGPHMVTYSSTGLKTVTLTVNGGNTNTKTDYVNVIDPSINMSSATIAACNGSFFDPGGPAANYGNNQDFTTLLTPGIPGSMLQVDFTSFNLEAASPCNKDYLKIYDGNNIFSPLLGTYCGTNSPGTVTATNTSGSLLFVFHSNATTTMPGWEANIVCTAVPIMNPTALSATATGPSEIDLHWTPNPDNNNVLLAWSPTGTFGTPATGTSYSPGSTLPGGGTVIANGNTSSFAHTSLSPSTTYYYKAFSVTTDLHYSLGIEASATTLLQPTLSVNPLLINVAAPATDTSFTINSNTQWTTSSDQSWCIPVASGTGLTQASVSLSENTFASQRVAHVSVTVASLPSQTVTINQSAAAPYLTISPDQPGSAPAANSIDFTIHTNTVWVLSSDQSWCVPGTLSGSGDGTSTASIAENFSVAPRVAHITVTGNGTIIATATITQDGAAPFLNVTPPTYNVNAYENTVTYTVNSNTNWTALSDAGWCTVTPSGTANGTIQAVCQYNPSGSERIANISISASGVSTQVVTVAQNKVTAGVSETRVRDVLIYPNPTKGVFSIQVDKTKYPEFKVQIADAVGNRVLERECSGAPSYEFDLGRVANGAYFVKILLPNETLITRLIVN